MSIEAPRRHPVFRTLTAGLLVTASAIAVPTYAATFRVGNGAGCTHSTINLAITVANNSPGPDTIRIARNQTYTSQHLVVNPTDVENNDLSLIGGFSSCNDSEPDEPYTVLNGGINQVIAILKPVDVSLSHLEITGGAGAALGGGVFHTGGATLTIENSLIIANQGGAGGGIHIDGEGEEAETRLTLGPGVEIMGNTADNDGGGVYCRNASIVAIEAGTGASLNLAGARGGGWFLDGCDATLASDGVDGEGIAYFNTAGAFGGGIAAMNGSDIRIYGRNEDETPRIAFNKSTGSSGGIAIIDSKVDAWQLAVIRNSAPFSGGVSVTANPSGVSHGGARFDLRGHLADSPAGAVACKGGRACGGFFDNTAASETGIPQIGGAIRLFSAAGSASASVRLANVTLSGNEGANLIDGFSPAAKIPGDAIVMRSVLIHDNRTARLANLYATPLDMLHVTVAGNSFRDTALLDLEHEAAIERLLISKSILWQPGKHLLQLPEAEGALRPPFVSHVIVNSTVGLPGSSDILVADPHFIDAVGDDYRLRSDSPAVEFSDIHSESDEVDLDGRPRRIDQTHLTDLFGPYDLGAYEMPLDPDVIFANNFERQGGPQP